MCSATKIMISCSLAASLVACSTKPPKNDSGTPKPDAAPVPLVSVHLYGPYYGQTNLAANTFLGLNIMQGRTSTEKAADLIRQYAVVESYPGGRPVKGSWAPHVVAPDDLRFKPKGGFAPGDYLLRFPNASADFQVFPIGYNFFRIGPGAPRLAVVHLTGNPTGDTKSLSRVELRFSEALEKTNAITLNVEQKAGVAWKPVTPVVVDKTRYALDTSVDPKSHLRIMVNATNIDSDWSGKTGAGTVTVEFLPEEHQIEPGQVMYYVPPQIDVALPSYRP